MCFCRFRCRSHFQMFFQIQIKKTSRNTFKNKSIKSTSLLNLLFLQRVALSVAPCCRRHSTLSLSLYLYIYIYVYIYIGSNHELMKKWSRGVWSLMSSWGALMDPWWHTPLPFYTVKDSRPRSARMASGTAAGGTVGRARASRESYPYRIAMECAIRGPSRLLRFS